VRVPTITFVTSNIPNGIARHYGVVIRLRGWVARPQCRR